MEFMNLNTTLNNGNEQENNSIQKVDASWLRIIYVALKKQKLPADNLFSSIGINIESLNDLEYIEQNIIMTLYQKIDFFDGLPQLPVSIAEIFQLHTFRYSGNILSDAKSVDDMLTKIIYVYSKITQLVTLETSKCSNFTQLDINPIKNSILPSVSLEIAICIINQISNIIFPLISGGIVNIILPKSSNRTELENVFKCPVIYSNENTYAVIFNNNLLQTKNIFTTSTDKQSHTPKKQTEIKIHADIEKLICDNIAKPDLNIVFLADQMNMSIKTLQRLLEKFNTNFSELVRINRLKLALSHLKEDEITIKQITYLLGFQSTSSFSRAFKKWTGHSPSTFKKMN